MGDRPESGVVSVTKAVEDEVGRLGAGGSPEAAVALALAVELDAGESSGAGLASCAKQLVAVLGVMRAGVEDSASRVSVLDEIAARRAARGARGGVG